MQTITTEEIVKAVKGQLLSNQNSVTAGVTTDSREDDLSGKLFIPLKGENFDAHKFVEQAAGKGAHVILVHEWQEQWDLLKETTTFIQVEDTLKALQQLGTYWRNKMKAKIVGITGSNGKTTTKDFACALLSEVAPTVASQGSFNNHWGVPLSLLTIEEEHEYAVIEMGMNHPGEITELCKIAQPDVVCVTNVGRAHLGHFKDVSEIAAAKQEIYQAAPAECRFAFNIDNEWTLKMQESFGRNDSITFATNTESALVFLEMEKPTKKGFKVSGHIGTHPVIGEVNFWGVHNLQNLAAASSLCLALGIEPEIINGGFEKCQTGWGRNQWIDLKSGASVMFDAYNANPDSFLALIKNLKTTFEFFDKKIGVFGEMLEMGSKAEALHLELGQKMAQLDWDKVVFFGPSGEAFRQGWQSQRDAKNLIITNTYEEVLDLEWANMLNEQSIIVVKGSRGQKLERVVEQLQPIGFQPKS